MRQVPNGLALELAKEATTLAILWEITREDDVVRRFTNLDRDVVFGGNTFVSAHGFNYSAIYFASGSGNQNLTMEFLLDESGGDAGIEQEDLMQGAYDNAKCNIRLVNYVTPSQGAIVLFSGVVGLTKMKDNEWCEFEITSDSKSTREFKSETYSVTCRADFGDERCKVDIDALKIEITVDEVINQNVIKAGGLTQDIDYWRFGTLRWTSGRNVLFPVEIVSNNPVDETLSMYISCPFPIEEGDTAEIWPGCDKFYFSGCARWNNKLNFRGEIFTGVALPAGEAIATPTPTAEDVTGKPTTLP